MEEQRKQIGTRIKQRRKALHRTQDDVAEYLGCSNNTVSSIETGKQKEKMTKSAAKGVANVLNSVLRTEANTTSCLALCQPKAPKELSRFKKSK